MVKHISTTVLKKCRRIAQLYTAAAVGYHMLFTIYQLKLERAKILKNLIHDQIQDNLKNKSIKLTLKLFFS